MGFSNTFFFFSERILKLLFVIRYSLFVTTTNSPENNMQKSQSNINEARKTKETINFIPTNSINHRFYGTPPNLPNYRQGHSSNYYNQTDRGYPSIHNHHHLSPAQAINDRYAASYVPLERNQVPNHYYLSQQIPNFQPQYQQTLGASSDAYHPTSNSKQQTPAPDRAIPFFVALNNSNGPTKSDVDVIHNAMRDQNMQCSGLPMLPTMPRNHASAIHQETMFQYANKRHQDSLMPTRREQNTVEANEEQLYYFGAESMVPPENPSFSAQPTSFYDDICDEQFSLRLDAITKVTRARNLHRKVSRRRHRRLEELETELDNALVIVKDLFSMLKSLDRTNKHLHDVNLKQSDNLDIDSK